MNDLKNHIFVFDHDGTLTDTTQVGGKVFPGIKALLKFLSGQNISLYVWTARDRKSTLRIMKENQINTFFKDLACVDDGVYKPDIEALIQMVGENKKLVLIGDSRADMIAGQNYGAFCIGVDWTSTSESVKLDLQKYGADIVFNRPYELHEFLIQSLGE